VNLWLRAMLAALCLFCSASASLPARLEGATTLQVVDPNPLADAHLAPILDVWMAPESDEDASGAASDESAPIGDFASPMHANLKLFNFTYEYGGYQKPLGVMGYEPMSGTGLPVYLFCAGMGNWIEGFNETAPEARFPVEMARRGFISVMMELPDIPGLSCPTLERFSRMLFNYTSSAPSTALVSPLARICGRPRADCRAGLALHGSSIGALLLQLAPQYAEGVSALLMWAAGSRIPGGYSCCGAFSGNRSCCEGAHPVVGGSPIQCERYEVTRHFLDRSRRRLILADYDHEYGDCTGLHGGVNNMCHHAEGMRTGAKSIGRTDSGYDCGEATNCLQPDGSGYYIPTFEDFGEEANTNGHNFYRLNPGPDEDNAINALLPEFVHSPDPFGLANNMDWITATAVRR